MGHPLPAIRTLQQRVEHISMQPGIQKPIFNLMANKVSSMCEEEKICVLCFDEMSIEPKLEYHPETGSFVGEPTLPRNPKIQQQKSDDTPRLASKALVFNIAGLFSHWKQVVAYHFTDSSVSTAALKQVVLEILHECYVIGLYVKVIVCDMGPCNQGLWSLFDIKCDRNVIQNKIPHPFMPDKSLFFMPDIPHVFKNICNTFVSGKNFVLDDEIVQLFNLESNVNVDPIRDLLDFQDDHELKLCHKLSEKVLDCSSHFNKMNVGNSCNLFDRRLSSALKLLVLEEGRCQEPTFTVAWFIDLLALWFEYGANRHPVMALSRRNLENFNAAISLLKNVILVFKSLRIGNGAFKPIQRGVILATTTLLDVSLECLDYHNFSYILTGRMNQDCVENLFSVVRSKNPLPTPLYFARSLKQICMSQFLHVPSNSNYNVDDSDYLADLVSATANVPMISSDLFDVDAFSVDDVPRLTLSAAEQNTLYYVAGYCLHSIVISQNVCDDCVLPLLLCNERDDVPCTLTKLREYRDGALFKVSKSVYDMFFDLECMFRQQISVVAKKCVKVELCNRAKLVCSDYSLPNCHDIKSKLISKFLSVRIHTYANSRSKMALKEKNTMGSKSVAMRSLASKVKS
jgi:hypothetical protein